MGNSGELPAKQHEALSTTGSAQSGGSNENLLLDFGRSVAYSAIEAPVMGLTQIFDAVTGSHVASKLPFSAPSAKFGSLAWHVEQIGGAIGMMLPLIGVSKGIKGVSGLLRGGADATAAADLGLSETGLLSQRSLFGMTAREAALTGFTMNAVLEPSQYKDGSLGSFALSRLESGGIGAATFASMAVTGLGVKRFAGSTIFGNDVVAGVVSGIPAGAISSEFSALQSGHALPTGQDLGHSIYTYSLVGGLFGAGSWLKAPATDGSGTTNYENLSNKLQYRVDGLRQTTALAADRIANVMFPNGGTPALAYAAAGDGFAPRATYDFSSAWNRPNESYMQAFEGDGTRTRQRSFSPGDTGGSAADSASRPAVISEQARARIEKFAQLEGRINSAGDHQSYIQSYMKQQLGQLQARGVVGKEWQVFPTQAGSPADMIGGDFIMVNSRTGEYHLLDATSNREKYDNPSRHNVANIRSEGLIYYDKPIFDQLGKLRTDSSEPPNITDAVANFQQDISSNLISLSRTASPLNLNEIPLPSITALDAAQARAQVEAYSNLVDKRAAETNGYGAKRDLEDFARTIRKGTSTYLDKSERTVGSTEFHDTVGKYADRAIVSLAVSRILGTDMVISEPEKALSEASYHAKGESLKLEVNGTIYDSGNVKSILSESRSRVLKGLPELITDGQMKSLRKAMPGKTDNQILSAVTSQVTDLSNVINAGGKLGNGRPVLIDYIVARLKGSTPDVNLGIAKPEQPAAKEQTPNAERPISENERVLASQFAKVWNEQQFPKLQPGQMPDSDYVELVFDEMKSGQPAPIQGLYDAMLQQYQANDPTTVRAIVEALQK